MARLRAQARCCKSCCAWHTVREFPRVCFRMIFRRRSGIFGSIATILSVLHICGIMSGCRSGVFIRSGILGRRKVSLLEVVSLFGEVRLFGVVSIFEVVSLHLHGLIECPSSNQIPPSWRRLVHAQTVAGAFGTRSAAALRMHIAAPAKGERSSARPLFSFLEGSMVHGIFYAATLTEFFMGKSLMVG